MYRYPSYNPIHLERGMPNFQSPKIIGSFSLNGERNFVHDKSELQILKPEEEIFGSPIEFDLNVGFEESIRRPYKPEYVDNVLKWIVQNKNLIDDRRSQIFGADIITGSSIIQKIMEISYDNQDDGMLLRVMKWKNSIFIGEEWTEERKFRELNMNENLKRSSYYGFKFEDYMTNTVGSKTSPESKHKLPVDVNTEFRCMFKSKLGTMRLLYEGELDAYRTQLEPSQFNENIPLHPNNFVELKTSKVIEHPGQERTLRKHKFRHWWTQCCITGIKNVLVGWKDDEGFVKNVEEISVDEMSRSALDWRGDVCFNFLLDVLQFLQESIVENSLTQVYRLTFSKQNGLFLEIEEGTEPIIPEWFHSQFQ